MTEQTQASAGLPLSIHEHPGRRCEPPNQHDRSCPLDKVRGGPMICVETGEGRFTCVHARGRLDAAQQERWEKLRARLEKAQARLRDDPSLRKRFDR